VTEKSPFWFGDPRFRYAIWGSHFWFGDSCHTNPQTDSGIPDLDIWFGDPRIGLGIHATPIPKPIQGSPFWIYDLGIPELVWGYMSRESPNQFGDPRFRYTIWGSRFWFGDTCRANPQTNSGIPVLHIRFGDPVFGLGIHVARIPEPVRGSPFWIIGLGIPKPILGMVRHSLHLSNLTLTLLNVPM
jgi:hypothetical protein